MNIEIAPPAWTREEQDIERKRLRRQLAAGRIRYGEITSALAVTENTVRSWARAVNPVSRPYQARLRLILDATEK